jgi:hypothetical protein
VEPNILTFGFTFSTYPPFPPLEKVEPNILTFHLSTFTKSRAKPQTLDLAPPFLKVEKVDFWVYNIISIYSKILN